MADISFGLAPLPRMEFPKGSGEMVYPCDLPKPGTFRFTPKRRRLFVTAVKNGLITAEELLVKYGATQEELEGKSPATEEDFEKQTSVPQVGVARVGDVTIDFAAKSVRVGESGIFLTKREYMIFAYLMSRAGTVVTKANLQNYFLALGIRCPTLKYLDVYVLKIRRRLGVYEGYLSTVWGRGLVFKKPELL